jgi:hypothetical protein
VSETPIPQAATSIPAAEQPKSEGQSPIPVPEQQAGSTAPDTTQATSETAGVETAPEGTQAEPSAIERAKRAAKNARRDARRFREQSRETEQLRAQHAQAHAEVARLRGIEQALRSDPLAALKALGLTAQDIAKRLVKDGTPEALIANVQEQLEQERAERQKLEAQIQAEKSQAALRQAETRFVERASDTKRYPHVAEQPTALVLAAAKHIISVAGAQGYQYSDGEILDYLEREYAAKSKTPKTQVSSASGANGKSASPASSRTLTNGLSSSRFSVPANWDSLDDASQKKILADQIASLKPHT